MATGFYPQPWDGSRICFGPAAVAGVTIAATLISTAVAVKGQMDAGDAKATQAAYQAQIAANNKKVAERNAQYAEQAGAAQGEQSALRTRALVGEAVAAQASSGLDVNTGSALDVRSSLAALGQLSGLRIRDSAARTAYGYRVQGADYGALQAFYEKSSTDAAVAGDVNAMSTLLGGITAAGNMTVKDYQAGVFPTKLTS